MTLAEELKALERRFKKLEHDPIVRMAASNYKAMVHKAKADLRQRYISDKSSDNIIAQSVGHSVCLPALIDSCLYFLSLPLTAEQRQQVREWIKLLQDSRFIIAGYA
jgi:ABC-type microcin C transport system permease subunit YejB